MVIWTGWGILAALIWVFILAVTQGVLDGTWEPGYYKANLWPKLAVAAVTAPVIWIVGRQMNRRSEDDIIGSAPKHTLFFIPMEYWGPLFAIIGVSIAFGG